MQSLHGREEAERAEKTEKGVALHVEQLHSLLVSGRVIDRLSSSTGQMQKISLFYYNLFSSMIFFNLNRKLAEILFFTKKIIIILPVFHFYNYF